MAIKKSTPATSDEVVTHSPAPNVFNVVYDVEKKIGQLSSLLFCSYGFGSEWMEDMGNEHRENIMWLMSDLCADIEGQFKGIQKFVVSKEVNHG